MTVTVSFDVECYDLELVAKQQNYWFWEKERKKPVFAKRK